METAGTKDLDCRKAVLLPPRPTWRRVWQLWPRDPLAAVQRAHHALELPFLWLLGGSDGSKFTIGHQAESSQHV